MLTPEERADSIERIISLPKRLQSHVEGLSDEQLDTPYRDGGWTVRQVVHHLADSHLNAYTRTRLALTEDHPTIKPYDQDAWAVQADYALPLDASLKILEGVHFRWGVLWQSVSDEQFARTLHHPDNGTMSIDDLLRSYAQHGDSHLQQIRDLRTRKGW